MEGRVCANKFRKAAVSATMESQPGDEKIHKDLANLMGHKKTTADRYYYLEEKIESSDRAAKALPAIMRRSAPEEPHDNKEERVQEQIERKRTTFSIDEVEEIRDAFGSEIKDGVLITMELVRTRMNSSESLKGKDPRRI
eukprot:Seg6277.3 transcript_id=Seg6277.3/GoldUCD/mRNA.D3Y31 product="hypothetical protein" protein_id=Seg6277.3/GoldUCD/D3Y31